MIPLGTLGAARPRASGGGTYTTLNPLDKASGVTVTGGNLIASNSGGSVTGIVRSVHAIAGKRYFEAVFTTVTSGGGVIAAGVATTAADLNAYLGSASNTWAAWATTSGLFHSGAQTLAYTAGAGDVFGFAVDQPGGKLWVRKNGSWLTGDPAAGTSPAWSDLSGTLHAAACPYDGGNVVTMRFDPASFSHAAPAGFDPILA